MHQNPQRDNRGRIIPPSSTDKTIIFPYNQDTKKFNTDHYNPCMTPTNFPTETLLAFFEDIEYHIKAYYSFCGFRLQKILNYIGYTLGVTYIIAVYAIIFLPMFTGEALFDGPFTMVYLVIALVIYAIPAGIISWRCTVLGERKLEEARKNVNLYINERAVDFKQRGLSWIVPASFPHWIELWKDDPALMHNFNPGLQQYQMHPVHMYNSNNHFARPGETAEMMQMHSTQQLYPLDVQIHPQPQQSRKGGYYGLNEESPSEL